jgi:hypothetical protein
MEMKEHTHLFVDLVPPNCQEETLGCLDGQPNVALDHPPPTLLDGKTWLWSEGNYDSSAKAAHMTDLGLTLPPKIKSTEFLSFDPAWFITEEDFQSAAVALNLLPEVAKKHPATHVDLQTTHLRSHDVDCQSTTRGKPDDVSVESPSVSLSATTKVNNSEWNMRLVTGRPCSGLNSIEERRELDDVRSTSNLHLGTEIRRQALVDAGEQVEISQASLSSLKFSPLKVRDRLHSCNIEGVGIEYLQESPVDDKVQFNIALKNQDQELNGGVLLSIKESTPLSNGNARHRHGNENDVPSKYCERWDPDVPLQSVERDEGDVVPDYDREVQEDGSVRSPERGASETGRADRGVRSRSPSASANVTPSLSCSPRDPQIYHQRYSGPPRQFFAHYETSSNIAQIPLRQTYQEARSFIPNQSSAKLLHLQKALLRVIATSLAPSKHQGTIHKLLHRFQASNSLPKVPLILRERFDTLLSKYRTDPNFLISTLSFITEKMGESTANFPGSFVPLTHPTVESGGSSGVSSQKDANVARKDDNLSDAQVENMSPEEIRAMMGTIKETAKDAQTAASEYLKQLNYYKSVSHKAGDDQPYSEASSPTPQPIQTHVQLTTNLRCLSKKQLEALEIPVWVCNSKLNNGSECGRENLRFSSFLYGPRGILVGVEKMACGACGIPPTHIQDSFPATEVNESIQQFTVVSTVSRSQSISSSISEPSTTTTKVGLKKTVHVHEQLGLRKYYNLSSTPTHVPADYRQGHETLPPTDCHDHQAAHNPFSGSGGWKEPGLHGYQPNLDRIHEHSSPVYRHQPCDYAHTGVLYFPKTPKRKAAKYLDRAIQTDDDLPASFSSTNNMSGNSLAVIIGELSNVHSHDTAQIYGSEPCTAPKKHPSAVPKFSSHRGLSPTQGEPENAVPTVDKPNSALRNKRSRLVLETDDGKTLESPNPELRKKRSRLVLETNDGKHLNNPNPELRKKRSRLILETANDKPSDILLEDETVENPAAGISSKKLKSSITIVATTTHVIQETTERSSSGAALNTSNGSRVASKTLARKPARQDLKSRIENARKLSEMEAANSMIDYALGGPRKSWERTREMPLPPAKQPAPISMVDLTKDLGDEADGEFDLDDELVNMEVPIQASVTGIDSDGPFNDNGTSVVNEFVTGGEFSNGDSNLNNAMPLAVEETGMPFNYADGDGGHFVTTDVMRDNFAHESALNDATEMNFFGGPLPYLDMNSFEMPSFSDNPNYSTSINECHQSVANNNILNPPNHSSCTNNNGLGFEPNTELECMPPYVYHNSGLDGGSSGDSHDNTVFAPLTPPQLSLSPQQPSAEQFTTTDIGSNTTAEDEAFYFAINQEWDALEAGENGGSSMFTQVDTGGGGGGGGLGGEYYK